MAERMLSYKEGRANEPVDRTIAGLEDIVVGVVLGVLESKQKRDLVVTGRLNQDVEN